MVEIDYYSKYLKYKQKYLKQKNLQIGGDNVSIQIKIENYPHITNWWITCDESKIIGEEIQKFLIDHDFMYKTYTLQHKKDGNSSVIDITKTFKESNIKDGKIIIRIT